MLHVGLTGGIGAGKSATAAHLATLGAVIIDSDVLAREVVGPGTGGLAAIAETFGPGVITDGALDRPALAGKVFGDPAARQKLEAIIHPRVRARSDELAAQAPPDAVVVHDIPLLTEVGLAPTFHCVLVVQAAHHIRLGRLTARGLSRDEAEARIAAQATDADRAAVADIVLDNSGSLEALHAQIDAAWPRLIGYEANLRAGRYSRRPEELAIVPSDPAWPARYARLAARIRHAAGDAVLSLDHIGSTSVPGLPAKDVIDIQLGVADLDTGRKIAPLLAAAGFPAKDGEWWDNPKPPGSPIHHKLMHGCADPGIVVHLHVRTVGSPSWRWALLFRDWLRATPGTVTEYATLKATLAAQGLTASDYAEAKEPWFDSMDTRAESWATTTNWVPGKSP
ncbi:dephospho-CoA kinase [Longispora albida]|uniref:dephospho-CoA kinase n=1 Tax=Longispora albida TaxID=203523 RepID=UPI0003779554|nr:dephospho-CoA kinase [Longispora albida]